MSRDANRVKAHCLSPSLSPLALPLSFPADQSLTQAALLANDAAIKTLLCSLVVEQPCSSLRSGDTATVAQGGDDANEEEGESPGCFDAFLKEFEETLFGDTGLSLYYSSSDAEEEGGDEEEDKEKKKHSRKKSPMMRSSPLLLCPSPPARLAALANLEHPLCGVVSPCLNELELLLLCLCDRDFTAKYAEESLTSSSAARASLLRFLAFLINEIDTD